jgi:hypothetical protein
MELFRLLIIIITIERTHGIFEVEGKFILCENSVCIEISKILVPNRFEICTRDFLIGFIENGDLRKLFLTNGNEIIPTSDAVECIDQETRFEFNDFTGVRIQNEIVRVILKKAPQETAKASPLINEQRPIVNKIFSKALYIIDSKVDSLINGASKTILTTKLGEKLKDDDNSKPKIEQKNNVKIEDIKSDESHSINNEMGNLKIYVYAISGIAFMALVVIILLFSKSKLSDLWLFLKATDFFFKKNKNKNCSINYYDHSDKMFTPNPVALKGTKILKTRANKEDSTSLKRTNVLAIKYDSKENDPEQYEDLDVVITNGNKVDEVLKKEDVFKIIDEKHLQKATEEKLQQEKEKEKAQKLKQNQEETERLKQIKENEEKKIFEEQKQLLIEITRETIKEEERKKEEKIETEKREERERAKLQVEKDQEIENIRKRNILEDELQIQKTHQIVAAVLEAKKITSTFNDQIACNCNIGPCQNCVCSRAKKRCNTNCHKKGLNPQCINLEQDIV